MPQLAAWRQTRLTRAQAKVSEGILECFRGDKRFDKGVMHPATPVVCRRNLKKDLSSGHLSAPFPSVIDYFFRSIVILYKRCMLRANFPCGQREMSQKKKNMAFCFQSCFDRAQSLYWKFDTTANSVAINSRTERLTIALEWKVKLNFYGSTSLMGKKIISTSILNVALCDAHNYDNTNRSHALVWHKTETRIIPVELSSQSVLSPKQQVVIYLQGKIFFFPWMWLQLVASCF